MLERARKLASQEFTRLSGLIINPQDCYVVWFSKTLQNWKALVSTNKTQLADYAEVTHNGDKQETYVDVYTKVSNKVFGEGKISK